MASFPPDFASLHTDARKDLSMLEPTESEKCSAELENERRQ